MARERHIYLDEAGAHRRFRDPNGTPLNDTHFELEVNSLEVRETTPDGQVQRFRHNV